MSQSKQILNYLKSGNKLNPLQALKKFGCFRLGARIFDLKEQGHNIESTLITKKGKTFSEYSYIGGKNDNRW